MTSSIEYHEKFHFQEIGTLSDEEVASVIPNSSESRTLGSLRPGIFNIPVCLNPGGEWLTEFNSDTYRNYPCLCGNVPVNEKGKGLLPATRGLDETSAFATAANLDDDEHYLRFCQKEMDCSYSSGKLICKSPSTHKNKANRPGSMRKIPPGIDLCVDDC